MGLFRRRPKDVDTQVEAEVPEGPKVGPFDISEVDDTEGRLNLGCLHIPAHPGMKVRIELDKNTKTPISVTCVIERSSVQLQLFAAPRSASLWDDIRPSLADSARDKGGEVDDVPGVFGRELLVKLPVTTKGGSGIKPVRFAGIDGPRWMIRAVFHGEAALNRESAVALEELVRSVVVDRGVEARPPREPIPLALPGQNEADETTENADPMGILRRGPEMTETR